MRWLVTGGAGFIGSHLVDAILDRRLGDAVVIDNLRRGRWDRLDRHRHDPRLALIEADIRDKSAVLEASVGADLVIHLAAQSNVLGASKDPAYSVETNVLGTVNVLQAALEAGARRLVFSSSREVYGDPPSLPVHEDSPLVSKNLYGASKVAGEAYCRAFQGRGLDVRILRFANVYGPGDADRVIPIWLDRAARGLDLEVYGGKQVLDLIWIDYVVEALLRAAEATTLPGPINVASGQGTAIVDLAHAVIRATDSASSVSFLPARGEEVVRFVANVAGMRAHLALAPPTHPLEHLPLLVKPRAKAPVL